jgi:uncharacterized protein YbjT (DUF2867 family)
MKVILFGATGMVGQGVLRECLASPDVEQVLCIGRSSVGFQSAKLAEQIHRDFLNFAPIESKLTGYDACFFCLGISSLGMTEDDYRRVTYGFALAAAEALVKLNPNMTFVYVSGMGTDGTGKGSTMWARVKGETENALFELPFKAAFMFRPGGIVPGPGIRSKTKLYQFFYTVLGPVLPLLQSMAPKYITTTGRIGQAMIKLARDGGAKRVLETEDINPL